VLAKDRSLAERQLDLSVVEQQLAEARESWRRHATVNRVLERIRADYEANRQPETLAEASRHLAKLTAGQYVRIWTPLSQDVLFVDNREKQSLPVEALSRGTREQLFLSVRLAIVAMFARRGVNLPMVLDDVLVNFDAVRARRAAEVLCEFAAAGHQLLVFTCHEHMWEMFKSLEADCRLLPTRRGGPANERPAVEPPPVEQAAPEPERRKKRRPRATRPPAAAPVPEFFDYPFVERLVEEHPDEPMPAPPSEFHEYSFEGAAIEYDDRPSDDDHALAYVVSADAELARLRGSATPLGGSGDHLQHRRA
jgi:hypothetical protein